MDNMTTETVTRNLKDFCRPAVFVTLFTAFLIGNMYMTILKSSYASEMDDPFALAKVPVVYVSMITDSIDGEMATLLPQEDEGTIPSPPKKPMIQVSSL